MDGEQPRRRDPRSIDRRTVLKAGLAAAVVGVGGGGLVGCTTSKDTRTAADSEAASASPLAAPTEAATSAPSRPVPSAPVSSPVAAGSASQSTSDSPSGPAESAPSQFRVDASFGFRRPTWSACSRDHPRACIGNGRRSDVSRRG